MKSLKIMLNVMFTFLVVFSARASEGEYDLRFVQVESEQAGVALIDIEMRATASDKEFYLAEQNFRFSFNENAVFLYHSNQPSVLIEQELSVSGQVAQSFYAPHHLNGSEGNIISYNVELIAGEGINVTADEWIKIGRLAFQLKDANTQLKLTWHRVEDFPPTYIVEKKDGQLTRANEGNIEDFSSLAVSTDNPLATGNAIQVFPNPATNVTAVNLTINSESTRGAGQIVISDALGRAVNTQAVSIVQGLQNYNLNVKTLSAGTYRVHIQTEKWQSVSRPLIIIEK